MANLTDTLVNGSLRATKMIYGTLNAAYITDANTAIPPLLQESTTSGSSADFVLPSSGTNGPIMGSNNWNIHATIFRSGTTYRLTQIATGTASTPPTLLYIRAASSSDGSTWTWGSWKASSMSGHTHAAGDITSGTLPITRGGTGQTTAQGIVDGTIQDGIADQSQASSDVTDTTEIITTHVNGYSSTNKRLYRRTAVKLWNYIKGKLTSVAGVNISGNAATASSAQSGSALETAINNKADKSSTVSNVAWDSTNKKLTKTINGSTSDVVTATTLKSAMSLNNVTNDAQVKRTEMGTANGVATLDANGVINTSQLPSYVDDVLEYSAKSQFPATGETGKIYVDTSTNLTWRWSGTTYVEISPSLALGETSSTAYRGDRGKTAYDHSQLTSGNPHHVTAADVSAVRYDTNAQGLTDTQKSNARTNIGAGTSSLTIGTTATTAAAGNHGHGNITNGGALQTNDITIASGDKLVVTDASDSNKLARTSVAFDGTTTAKALTQKGTFETVMTPSEAMSLSGGDGVDVTVANNAATLSANISSIPTSVIEALS